MLLSSYFTEAFCLLRSIGRRQLSASRPWSVFSSSSQEWPFLCISASATLRHVLLSPPLSHFPYGFKVRACLVMLLGGQFNPTFFNGSVRPLVRSLLSPQVLVVCLLWPPDTEDFEQTAIAESRAYGILLRLKFSTFLLHTGLLTSRVCRISSTCWIFQSLSSSKLSWESGRQFALCLFLPSRLNLSHPECQPYFLNW